MRPMITTKIHRAWSSYTKLTRHRSSIGGIALNEMDYDGLEMELKAIQRYTDHDEPASRQGVIMFALPGHALVEVYRCTPMFEGVRFMVQGLEEEL